MNNALTAAVLVYGLGVLTMVLFALDAIVDLLREIRGYVSKR